MMKVWGCESTSKCSLTAWPCSITTVYCMEGDSSRRCKVFLSCKARVDIRASNCEEHSKGRREWSYEKEREESLNRYVSGRLISSFNTGADGSAEDISRYLIGAYIDWDDFWSKRRVLQKNLPPQN